MNKSLRINWSWLLIGAFLLAGCRPVGEETNPTTQPEAVLTAAAQTAEAQLTELARPTPTATLTPTPAVTLVPVTPSPIVDATVATDAGTVPAGTVPAGTLPPSTSGDQAEYWADITIPDGTNFGPGEAFTKTWRIINSGTTTWTSEYSLAFLGGVQMSGPPSVNLTTSVAPGDTVDVSVDMVSPDTSGNYQGFWKMRNAAGEFFDFAVFVEINVVGGEPGATATPGGNGAGGVSGVTLAVDNASAEGCPHTFSFTPSFTLDEAATVTYRFEAGSDTPGFEFDLPADQTASFESGTRTLEPFTLEILEIADSVSGWVQFHIVSPEDAASDQVEFSLTCD